jgi:hypothetical protein
LKSRNKFARLGGVVMTIFSRRGAEISPAARPGEGGIMAAAHLFGI